MKDDEKYINKPASLLLFEWSSPCGMDPSSWYDFLITKYHVAYYVMLQLATRKIYQSKAIYWAIQ
jgi:hypothetical protein